MTDVDPNLQLYDEALARARLHRLAILASSECGCFACFTHFMPSEITRWIEQGQTALCPRCGIDSVVGDDADGRRTDEQFLRRLSDHLASPPPPPRTKR